MAQPVQRHERGRQAPREAGTERAEHKALAAAGVTVVLWASAFVAIRSAGREFSPGALALGRLLCGSAVLSLVAWRRREGWPPRAAWPGTALSGILWFGVYMVTLNWGEQKVDAGTAAMVVSLGPVLIALLSWQLLGEGVSPGLLAGVVVALAGVVVVGTSSSGEGHRPVAGVVLCLLAALSFAVSVTSQKRALRHASAAQVITFGALVGTLACLPFSGQLVSDAAVAPLSATLSVCYLGVFPTAIGFTTWGYALARTPAGKMGATTYLVPALAVLLSWAFLGEVPSATATAGGALCLAGVAISRRRRRAWPGALALVRGRSASRTGGPVAAAAGSGPASGSLRSQDESSRGACRAAPGERGDEVREAKSAHGGEDDRPRGHGGVGHCVDIAGEQSPQLAPDNDAERYAQEADDGGNGRLPSYGGRHLSFGEPEGLE